MCLHMFYLPFMLRLSLILPLCNQPLWFILFKFRYNPKLHFGFHQLMPFNIFWLQVNCLDNRGAQINGHWKRGVPNYELTMKLIYHNWLYIMIWLLLFITYNIPYKAKLLRGETFTVVHSTVNVFSWIYGHVNLQYKYISMPLQRFPTIMVG